MRMTARTTLLAAAAIPLAIAAAAPASATEAADVTYAFTVTGSTVTNTITNNTGATIGCTTSLAPAPSGVLPPVDDVLRNGQSLYQQDDIPPGTTTQSVTDVPDGSYVALASCGSEGTDPAMWVSDYPGIERYLAQFPMTAYTVQQASTVVTVPDVASAPAPPAADIVPDLSDLGTLFGS
ncbi:hypothetical protein [Rhodococcus jostii]|uniref:Secreted protein n=1 Tax=Rhodococcus jostii TaxID=132919 RepID=A0A1H5EMN3_RHOJO|nr:hypothetical protein [Rhodococcus jostii]SED92382.1 hypothetical protein SAMN04490220_6052 [Rhodococcus jostii]